MKTKQSQKQQQQKKTGAHDTWYYSAFSTSFGSLSQWQRLWRLKSFLIDVHMTTVFENKNMQQENLHSYRCIVECVCVCMRTCWMCEYSCFYVSTNGEEEQEMKGNGLFLFWNLRKILKIKNFPLLSSSDGWKMKKKKKAKAKIP